VTRADYTISKHTASTDEWKARDEMKDSILFGSQLFTPLVDRRILKLRKRLMGGPLNCILQKVIAV